MNLIAAPTSEVFAEATNTTVTVTPWHNGEGCTVVIHGPNLALQGFASLTWDTADALVAALMQARSA